jgi:hypothetical protein
MQVHGSAPELDSSYFLDRDFWLDQLRGSPEGIVAAVPDRGGLVFARADDEAAIATLRFSAAALFASSDSTRISSGLYLFKDGRWSVFQPPRRSRSTSRREAPAAEGALLLRGQHTISAVPGGPARPVNAWVVEHGSRGRCCRCPAGAPAGAAPRLGRLPAGARTGCPGRAPPALRGRSQARCLAAAAPGAGPHLGRRDLLRPQRLAQPLRFAPPLCARLRWVLRGRGGNQRVIPLGR